MAERSGSADAAGLRLCEYVRRCALHGRELRLKLAPSVSIFDPSFLRIALAFHHAGALPPGAMIKLYFGGERLPFGLPPTRASLDAYLAMLDGTGLHWSVAVLGGDVVGCALAGHALQRGGHLRVGLEDYAGERKPTNVELVERVVDLIERSDRRVATPRETEDLLRIPRRSAPESPVARQSHEP